MILANAYLNKNFNDRGNMSEYEWKSNQDRLQQLKTGEWKTWKI